MSVAHEGGIFASCSLERGSPEEPILRSLNNQVITEFGLVQGITHSEFIKGRDDGELYFLETAARVGGAHIAELVEAAAGINLWTEWAKLELAGTVSPTFLQEVIEGRHDFVAEPLRRELANKFNADCAVGILNAPDSSFNPATDGDLVLQFGPRNHVAGKQKNKRALQRILGLIEADQAPLFFWPSRLDTVQKGCQLLAEILLYEKMLARPLLKTDV